VQKLALRISYKVRGCIATTVGWSHPKSTAKMFRVLHHLAARWCERRIGNGQHWPTSAGSSMEQQRSDRAEPATWLTRSNSEGATSPGMKLGMRNSHSKGFEGPLEASSI
jgi:hypothetical protein